MRRVYTGICIGIIAVLLASCAGSSHVSMQVLKPADISMPGVKTVAVVDFQGQGRSGSQIATLVQSMLLETQYYNILEREKISRILQEKNMAMSGIVDNQTAIEVGSLLGVDALIFGEVTVYEVEPDQKITRKEKEKKHTGKYQWVEEKDKKTGKSKRVRKEIVEDVWVARSYWVRKGTVAINYRVVDVNSGVLLAAYSDSRSYDSSKKGGFFKSKISSQNSLKPKGEILNLLSKELCSVFARKIAPYYVNEQRIIEPGKGLIDAGRRYAESGLWPEAIETWEQAVREMPGEPAGYYNLGVALEVTGELENAEKAYKAAVQLNPKKLYMESLRRIRNAMQEREELRNQMGH